MVSPTRPRSFSVNEMATDVNKVNKVVPDIVVAILGEISAPEVKKLLVQTEYGPCFDVGSISIQREKVSIWNEAGELSESSELLFIFGCVVCNCTSKIYLGCCHGKVRKSQCFMNERAAFCRIALLQPGSYLNFPSSPTRVFVSHE